MNKYTITLLSIYILIFRYKMLDCMSIDTFNNNRDRLMDKLRFTNGTINNQDGNELSSYIIKELGSGAFGKVYGVLLKRKISQSTSAALKTVNFKTNFDKRLLTNETNFMQAVASNYPLFFLNYYGCVSGSNKVYIFTERMDRSLDVNTSIYPKQINTLFNALATQTLEVKVGLLFHMVMGVYVMHENNYVHYDIKPENFLVKSSTPPIIKVIDYGMVYDEANSLQIPGIRGSPEYMASEVLLKKNNFDKYKSDIYSLGLTIIETFYGVMYSLVNYGANMNNIHTRIDEFAKKRLNDYHNCFNPKFNRSRNCKLPSDMNNYPDAETALQALLLKMIAVELEDRPSSKEVIIVLYYILKKIDSKSIYLPENIKKLEKEVYNDHEIDDAPSIYNLKDKFGNGIYVPKINKKNRVPLIFDNLDEDGILNFNFKCNQARNFVINEINQSKPVKNYAFNPNKLTQNKYEGKKLDLAEHTGNQHAQYELKQNPSRPNKFTIPHKNFDRKYRSNDRDITRGNQDNMLKDPMINPMGKHRNPQYFDNNVDRGFPNINHRQNGADPFINQRIFGNYDPNLDIRNRASPVIVKQNENMKFDTKPNKPVLEKKAHFYPKINTGQANNMAFNNFAHRNMESPNIHNNVGYGKLPHISSPKVDRHFINPAYQALGNNYKGNAKNDKTTGYLGRIENAQKALKAQNIGSSFSRGTNTSSNENLKLPKIDDFNRTPMGKKSLKRDFSQHRIIPVNKNVKPWLANNNMNNAELLPKHGQGMFDRGQHARYNAQSPHFIGQKVYI